MLSSWSSKVQPSPKSFTVSRAKLAFNSTIAQTWLDFKHVERPASFSIWFPIILAEV